MKLINNIFRFCQVVIIILVIGLYDYATALFLPQKDYPEYSHYTLLIDRSFTQEEAADITSAAFEWVNATNHRVDFDIVYLPNTKEMLTKESILVVKAGPDYPDILLLDLTTKNTILGLYNNTRAIPTIELVTDRIDKSILRSVALHEIGHALGLEHNVGIEGFNTLMYPSIDLSSDSITFTDLQKFCEIRHCDANKLKN